MKKLLPAIISIILLFTMAGCSAKESHVFLDGNTDDYLSALKLLDYEEAKNIVTEYLESADNADSLTDENKAIEWLDEAINISKNYTIEIDEFDEVGELVYRISTDSSILSMHVKGTSEYPYCIVATSGDDLIGLYMINFKVDDEYIKYPFSTDDVYNSVLNNGNCYESGMFTFALSHVDLLRECDSDVMTRFEGLYGSRDISISPEIIAKIVEVNDLGYIHSNLQGLAVIED